MALNYIPQFRTTTLDTPGGLDTSQTTGIVLTSVPADVDITKAGCICVSYTNPINTDDAEWIHYTSISGANELQGVTRGSDGYSAKTHDNGVTIAWVISKCHINNVNDLLTGETTGATLDQPSLSAPSVTSDLKLATGSNIQVNATDPKRAFYVPANGLIECSTNGAASDTVETSTNDVNYPVKDFDASTQEYTQLTIPSPHYWDGSTVTVQFIWTAASSSGDVIWGAQGLSLSDDDALDTAYGTAQEVTDTLLATGDVHISSFTSAITIAGTPTAGDLVSFRFYRKAADAGDTLAADARLIGVKIRFGVAQYDDQ